MTTVKIHPADQEGFFINGAPINASTLKWVKEMWARFLQVLDPTGQPIKVVEHMISWLLASWVTQADIETTTHKNFFPVVWPGISPVVDALEWNVVYWNDLPNYEYLFEKPFLIESEVFPWASIKIEPSDTFDVSVSTKHSDVSTMWEQPLDIKDIESCIQDHLHARPIARVQNFIVYCAFHAMRKIPWQHKLYGINPETYILPGRKSNGDQIVEKMRPEYQEGRNEHYAHTIFSDFLGEVRTFFPWWIKAKITLTNTNHISRIELLRKLSESWVLSVDGIGRFLDVAE